MTTRNFRVNNGLEVGDITISASANTITGLSTSAPSGNGDVVTKAYSDSGTQTMTNKTLTSPVINSPTLNGTITATQITVNDLVSNGSNADITLDAAGTGDINLTAGADVNIPANIGLTFGNDAEKIEGDGTDLTISGNNINLTATADVNIPVNVGLTFATAEKIESDGTDLSFTVGSNGDINIPADIGLTFGDDGEKIEGDGTDLTISGNNINLTATADVVVPANVGITFGTHEKIESDDTDLNITVGSSGDINIGADIGLTFGDDGEKIEGDGTDLTIASSAKLNLSATSDVHIPKNVGIVFDDNGSEKIESNDTDLTINSGAKIKLTATSDVEIPNDVGIAYGTGGEKIESDGTDLTVTSTGVLNLTATGNTAITNNATVGGNLTVTGDFTVNGTTTTVSTTNTTIADNLIELNTGISQSFNDAGIIIERGSTGNNAAIIFDESADKFAMGLTTSTAADKSGGITVSVGTLLANLEGTATAAQYSDVAERFASDEAMAPGTVVALGGAEEICKVNEEGSDEVFGVVSSTDQAAFMMNGGAGNDETHPYIAMTGRVNVKVIGTVNKGDRLISASVPGYAKAATKAECTAFNVIGRALENKSDLGQGSILAAVRVSH